MSTDQIEPNQEGQVSQPAPAPANDRRVSIVLERDGDESRYGLFHAHGITAEGAFLAGSLFLELGEEVRLALPLGESDEIRTRARVVALDVGSTPGMHVIFPDLDSEDRALIEKHTGHTGNPRGGANG